MHSNCESHNYWANRSYINAHEIKAMVKIFFFHFQATIGSF